MKNPKPDAAMGKLAWWSSG